MASCEGVETAQMTTGKVTAGSLLETVRFGSDSLYVHGYAPHNRPSYSDAFVFTLSAVQKGKNKSETTQKLDVPGSVRGGHTSERKEHVSHDPDLTTRRWMTYSEGYRPTKGFWSFGCGRERLIDVLELLPRDAEVSFEVQLDAGTNELLIRSDAQTAYCIERGLHADRFVLVVEHKVRGKVKVRRYIVDESCGAHNTARFGVGR
jgi:hypothetical protein